MLNYSEAEEESTFRDSLEAELMLNYEAEDSSLRSIENTTPRSEISTSSRITPRKISTPASTKSKILTPASTPRHAVLPYDRLKDPLERILCQRTPCERTPSSSRRRPREFVVPSPPASTPRRVVLPHDRLKDPLADIMFGRTSSVSRISSVSSVSSRSSFFEPSSSRISISSSLEDEDEQDVHEEEEEEEGPPSNALFLERANARHRSDLDILLGSKSLRLASATLFDIIMPRASEIWNSKSIIFQTESWRWLRTFLDKAIDLEVAANIWCSDGAIDTEENVTNRVRFRT